jgi:hypothetical protein
LISTGWRVVAEPEVGVIWITLGLSARFNWPIAAHFDSGDFEGFYFGEDLGEAI